MLYKLRLLSNKADFFIYSPNLYKYGSKIKGTHKNYYNMNIKTIFSGMVINKLYILSPCLFS